MLDARKSHYDELDRLAKGIAAMSIEGSEMSEAILKVVIELYKSAKVEELFKNDHFETAYHSPVTSELEFIVARVFYRYSQRNGKEWKVLLRRQVGKTAPDIRIEVNGRTLAVIEIKAKVGWIQPFFSPNRLKRDQERLKSGESAYDPDAAIQLSKNQLSKYVTNFQITPNDIFLLLPTLALVHRKKYETTLPDYYEYFGVTSGLPAENLILLSSNLNLDLSKRLGDLMPTGNFERMLKLLDERTPPPSQSENTESAVPVSRNSNGATKRRGRQANDITEQPSPSCRFLTALIERGRTRTKAQFNTQIDNIHPYTGASSGIPGSRFFYVVATDRTRSELHVNNPRNQIRNKGIYDSLIRHKEKIETAFGGSLTWERMDDKNACRIAYRMRNGGYTDNENRWAEIQEEMVAAMVRLEHALGLTWTNTVASHS